MPNKVFRKVHVAESAVVFTSLNSLVSQAVAWSAPITGFGECDTLDLSLKITSSATPSGSVAVYVVRNLSTDRTGTSEVNTAATGSTATAGVVGRLLGTLGAPVKQIALVDDGTVEYVIPINILNPGPDVTVFVRNQTGQPLGTGNALRARGDVPEIQD